MKPQMVFTLFPSSNNEGLEFRTCDVRASLLAHRPEDLRHASRTYTHSCAHCEERRQNNCWLDLETLLELHNVEAPHCWGSTILELQDCGASQCWRLKKVELKLISTKNEKVSTSNGTSNSDQHAIRMRFAFTTLALPNPPVRKDLFACILPASALARSSSWLHSAS